MWAQTGARGTEADYLAYLSKFPNGLYNTAARTQLQRIEQENRASAEVVERAAWDDAKNIDTVAGYRSFLAEFPNGAFGKLAEARINQLAATDVENEQLAAAKREEKSLGMGPSMMVLVERKLKAIGLRPGKLDGTFTEETREAIRAYQNARGLAATGYVTRRTAVRLMTE